MGQAQQTFKVVQCLKDLFFYLEGANIQFSKKISLSSILFHVDDCMNYFEAST